MSIKDHISAHPANAGPTTAHEGLRPHYNDGRDYPLIAAYTAASERTSGDEHGTLGLARHVTRLLGGDLRVADEAELSDPCHDALVQNVRSYTRAHGSPDIVLGFRSKNFNYAAYRPTVWVDAWNEYLTIDDPAMKGFVPHHINTAMLAHEGAEFRRRSPGLRGPLIAVFLTEGFGIDTQTPMDLLAEACADYSESTVFFCPYRYTSDHHYHNVLTAFRCALIDRGVGKDEVDIISPAFNAPYNPYLGLLAEADHRIMLGYSPSICSENMAAGRQMHVVTSNPRTETDYIKCFSSAQPIMEDKVILPPRDVTEMVARQIVESFNRHARARAALESGTPQAPLKIAAPRPGA